MVDMYATSTLRLAHCDVFIARSVRIIQGDHCVSQLKMKITVKTCDCGIYRVQPLRRSENFRHNVASNGKTAE